MKALGHPDVMVGLFPLGSHGFDALHWSHYGQVVLYYTSRFLALTA
jgi:hypothetical protein